MLEPAFAEDTSRFTWEKPSPHRTSRIASSEETPLMGDEDCGRLMNEELPRLEADLEATKGLEVLDAAGVTSAPVVDDNGVLVGVVFLATLARLREVEELEVEDAMITDVISVSRTSTIADVAHLMARHHLERVPVVSDDGHLLGVVSAMDVVSWLAERLD